jgi:hypothetical protein
MQREAARKPVRRSQVRFQGSARCAAACRRQHRRDKPRQRQKLPSKAHEEIKDAFLTFQKDADQINPGLKKKFDYTGKSSVQAASFDWKKKAAAAAFAGAAATRKESVVARRALEPLSRYADLPPDEDQFTKNGKHLLVAYIMKPRAGCDYLATAAHSAAESSTGTNVAAPPEIHRGTTQ